ncbi:MAG: hypothetical protein V9G10_03185 [Candidatus Nanopelagicales bacterium]
MTPEQAQYFAQRFDAVVGNVERFIQGKDDVVRLALVALLAEGHVLMEDVPGTGKTSLARSLERLAGPDRQPRAVHPRPAARRTSPA